MWERRWVLCFRRVARGIGAVLGADYARGGRGLKGELTTWMSTLVFFGWDDPFAELNAEAASEQIHVRL